MSIRLPAILFGLGTIICFYLLSKILLQEFFDQKLANLGAYLAGFLMAISPWHLQFTHTGFEASSALFFVTLGSYLFLKGKKSKSLKLLIISFLSLGLSLYSYNSARIVVPVLTVGLMLGYFKSFKIAQWVTAILVFTIISVPFILFSVSPEGMARAREVVIFYYPQTQPLTKTLVTNYWQNVSPYYLFYYGDPTLSHTTDHRMSLLYFMEWPFFYLELILLILKIRKSAFVLIWFLIGSVPAAITILNPHALRSFLILPVLLFMSIFGFINFISFLGSDNLRKFFVSFYVVCLLCFCLNFLNIYHNFYIIDSGWDWLTDVKRVSKEVGFMKNNYEQIYFEEGGNRVIAYLWHLKYPPQDYQGLVNKKQIGNLNFDYSFSEINETGKNLYITRKPDLPAQLVRTIYYPNKLSAFYLYRI